MAYSYKYEEQGFTLVELLISMAVGLAFLLQLMSYFASFFTLTA